MPEAAAHLSADDLARLLGRRPLIEALRDIFRDGCEAPMRHHHTVPVPGGQDATMLLMPAWIPGRYLGTKIANVFPDNGRLGLPAVQSIYLLFSGRTGELLASMDGSQLTARRTVAASSLAVDYLARPDASRLLVVGAGEVACQFAASHAAVRPIRQVAVWARDPSRATALAQELARQGFEADTVSDLERAVASADIVSCATLSREPLIRGEWLNPGTHLDLVGGFTPAMREADDEAIRRASVFIDTEGARREAGDIAGPLASGVLANDAIVADFASLTRGLHPGRTSDREITLFKSVGTAAEDLAAAQLAYRLATDRSPQWADQPPR